jgi:hypothetical protein
LRLTTRRPGRGPRRAKRWHERVQVQESSLLNDLATFRLSLLRAGYLLLVVGLGSTIWPAIVDHTTTWELLRRVVVSMLGATSLLAVLAGFVVYIAGGALVSSATGAPDFLSTIAAHQTARPPAPF